MKFCIILFFIFTLNLRTFAKEIIIKINAEECSNCTKIIDFLQKETNSSKHKFYCIFQSVYKKDSAKYVNKFLLSKFKDAQVNFSDSIYEQFNRAAGSEVIVLSSKKNILFRSDFRKFDSKVYVYVSNSKENVDGDIIVDLDKSYLRELMYIYGSSGFQISFNYEGKDFIYNIINGKIVEIRLNDIEAKMAYTKLYRDSAAYQLRILSYMSKQGTDNFAPQTLFTEIKNDSICESIVSLNKISIQGTDTIIESDYIIIKYDIVNQKVLSFIEMPKFISIDYFVLPIFFSFPDKTFFIIRKRDLKDLDILYNLMVTDNRYRSARIYASMLLSDNYVKNKIYYNFMQPKVRNGLFSNIFSNELFNLVTEKKIKIPIDDSLFEGVKYILNRPSREHNIPDYKLKYVSIYDAYYSNGNFYRILYGYKSIIHLLDFDESGILMDKALNNKPIFFQTATNPIFVGSEHYILTSKKDDGVFFLKYVD